MVVAGSAPLRLVRRFFFWSTDKFPARRRAIPWEIALCNAKGRDSGAHNELITGNGPPFCRVFAGIFREPMPVIGVRRVIMQCREHDDDRAAPALALGPEIPMASAFQPAIPEQGVFSGGWGVGGFVDSWPKTLVPSVSNRSTAEWTLVDSRHGRFDQERLRARESSRRRKDSTS